MIQVTKQESQTEQASKPTDVSSTVVAETAATVQEVAPASADLSATSKVSDPALQTKSDTTEVLPPVTTELPASVPVEALTSAIKSTAATEGLPISANITAAETPASTEPVRTVGPVQTQESKKEEKTEAIAPAPVETKTTSEGTPVEPIKQGVVATSAVKPPAVEPITTTQSEITKEATPEIPCDVKANLDAVPKTEEVAPPTESKSAPVPEQSPVPAPPQVETKGISPLQTESTPKVTTDESVSTPELEKTTAVKTATTPELTPTASDSPPLAHTPSKEEAISPPAAKCK